MGSILSTSGTRVNHILQKSGNTVTEIGELANHMRISCDRYVRQPYYQQSNRMVLPDFSQETDDLRIITTGAPYVSINAPINGWVDDETGKQFPGAFAFYGAGPDIKEHPNLSPEQYVPYEYYRDQMATFTNGGHSRDGYSMSDVNYPFLYILEDGNTYYYPSNPKSNPIGGHYVYIDNKMFGLPNDGFSVYDLPLLNNQQEYPSFYHVSLVREFDCVFHREIYPPITKPKEAYSTYYGTSYRDVFTSSTKGTVEFIGDASPVFFYLDGSMYKKFMTTDKETTMLYRPTVTSSFSQSLPVSPAAVMYSYTHSPVRTSALAANLSFIPDADDREDKTTNYRYAPIWFQWYRSAPLKMFPEVVFTDAKRGTYPTLGKVVHREPWQGCGVSFLSSGSPVTSMLIPLQLVWDSGSARYSPPSGFLIVYPYVDSATGTLISHEGQRSRFPLVRFECAFERVESPSHVEVIPAANTPKDDADWEDNMHRLAYFPHVDSNYSYHQIPGSSQYIRFPDLTPDTFLESWRELYDPGYGDFDSVNNMPIMPRHVLLEGKLRPEDPWDMLDVIELPFKYTTLPYPLYRLCYKRQIRYVRFTVMSIYMSMVEYPNVKYTHLYFPKMDFFTKPEH